MIKSLFNKKNFSSFIEDNFFYLYFFKEVINEYRINKKYKRKFYSKCNKNDLQEFTYEKLKKNKKSDTLFILGSGSSINNISKEMWEDIKSHDSFGFNFWIVHNHIPNYFMFEAPSNSDNFKIFRHWLEEKAKVFSEKETCILMKDFKSLRMKCDDIPADLKDNFMLLPKDNFYGRTEKTFKKSINFAKKLNLLSRNTVYTRRASLFSALYIGWRLGYKKIVLAGIDLNNTDYFYESEQYNDILVPKALKKGEVHATVKPNGTDFSVDELVYLLNDELIKPSGAKLFILNENSLLSQKLPVYKLYN